MLSRSRLKKLEERLKLSNPTLCDSSKKPPKFGGFLFIAHIKNEGIIKLSKDKTLKLEKSILMKQEPLFTLMPRKGQFKDLRIYIGCALTHASEEFKAEVEEFKDHLRGFVTVLDFVGLVAGTSADVYNHDIHRCVATSDLFVAVCDLPSIGLGWELGTQVEKRKQRTMIVTQKGTKLTRLAIGAAEVNHFVSLSEYEKLTDLIPEVIEVLEVLYHEKRAMIPDNESPTSVDPGPLLPAFAAGVEHDSQAWMLPLLAA